MRTRTVLMTVLGLVVIAGVAAYAFRGALAMRLMASFAERAITRDFIAELPNGLHVALCGSGSPLPDPKRSGPCVAVIAGSTVLLVDAGGSASRNLGRINIPTARLDAVLLTHFHSDHIDGLGEVFLQRWAGAAQHEPLPVIGPTGVTSVVDGFNAAYRLDARYRIAHHGEETMPPSGQGGIAREFAAPPDGTGEVVWQQDGLTVRALRVDHSPVEPAVGYRFDYGSRALLISGDTIKSANLQQFAQGVDVLVHEALAPQLVAIMNRAATAAGRDNLAHILRDIPDYHATPVQAAEIARDAAVPHLLFHHVVPPLLVPGAEAAFLDGVADVYSGAVTLGQDGTMISLPADSKEILTRELLY